MLSNFSSNRSLKKFFKSRIEESKHYHTGHLRLQQNQIAVDVDKLLHVRKLQKLFKNLIQIINI